MCFCIGRYVPPCWILFGFDRLSSLPARTPKGRRVVDPRVLVGHGYASIERQRGGFGPIFPLKDGVTAQDHIHPQGGIRR